MLLVGFIAGIVALGLAVMAGLAFGVEPVATVVVAVISVASFLAVLVLLMNRGGDDRSWELEPPEDTQ